MSKKNYRVVLEVQGNRETHRVQKRNWRGKWRNLKMLRLPLSFDNPDDAADHIKEIEQNKSDCKIKPVYTVIKEMSI